MNTSGPTIEPPSQPNHAPNILEDHVSKALATLLDIEERFRDAKFTDELTFLGVNQLHRLFAYREALWCEIGPRRQVRVKKISGNVSLNAQAPYIQFHERMLGSLVAKKGFLNTAHATITQDQLKEPLHAGWQEYSSLQGVWVSVQDPVTHRVVGGFWFALTETPPDNFIQVAIRMARSFGYSYAVLEKRHKRRLQNHVVRFRRRYAIGTALMLMLLALPVRMNVLVPAEIRSASYVPITMPLDGVIREIPVDPNQTVHKGDPLIILDDTSLRKEYVAAEKAHEVAQEELRQARQQAMFHKTEQTDNARLLEIAVEQKRQEAMYSKQLLERTTVYAPMDGVIVMNEKNHWLGKPVLTGEHVLEVANLNDVSARAYIPPYDRIVMPKGSEAKIFLNSNPLLSIEGEVERINYSATGMPDGSSAYEAHIRIQSYDTLPTLGEKGTAKLYGKRTPLFYYLFRRPIHVLIQHLE